MTRKTESFIHGLCTPLEVDMDKVVVIERRPDPNKIIIRFDSGWSIEVEAAPKGAVTRKEDIERIIERWSGRERYPDMVEAWSDMQGPDEGYGHAWVDLSACVTFDTACGTLGRVMTVTYAESHAPFTYWLRNRSDISQEEQNAELLLRWRRARGERI
jgi:hypothetical protein